MGPTHDRFGQMKTVLQTVVLWRSYCVYTALEILVPLYALFEFTNFLQAYNLV